MLPLAGCHLLLVDDDPDTADLHAFVLELAGAAVKVALGSAQALEVLERERIDVLVADMTLPDTDGVELLAQVHARRPELPAIATSASPERETRQRALEAGYIDYLAKPLSPQDLVRAVRSACAAAGCSEEPVRPESR